MDSLGKHILAELYDCNEGLLNDTKFIEKVMLKAAELSNATIVSSNFHKFSPHGVSGIVVIAESHMSIHTWPEYGFVAIDLFTCGDTVNPWVGFDFLKEELNASNISTIEMKRGQLHNVKGKLKHKPS